MKRFSFWLACVGWVVLFISHVLSLLKFDVTAHFSYIWIFVLLLFVVWWPTVMELKSRRKFQQHKGSSTSLGNYYHNLFDQTPRWLRVVAIGGFFYAFINFFLAGYMLQGSPEIKDGLFVLTDHGKIIRNISVQEFHYFKSYANRMQTGHFLVFYGMAVAILYPYRMRSR
ncbi:MAG: hypothetical protein IPM74_17805 [Crocinitomicaceae bacterium]|nr:hypothetical protein [Crocinitomicaceae bacterium]MBK8927703.1 hypothetical protein [Crocinitomicaceae bacterium]